MKIMRLMLLLVRSRAFYAIFLLSIVTACIWWWSPFLVVRGSRPFDTMFARAWVIALLAVGFAIVFFVRRWVSIVAERKRTLEITALLEEVDLGAVSSEGGIGLDGWNLIDWKFRENKSLRKLPLYFFIGTKGVGKTTYIRQSSLDFVLLHDGWNEPTVAGEHFGGVSLWLSKSAVVVEVDSDIAFSEETLEEIERLRKKVENLIRGDGRAFGGIVLFYTAAGLKGISKEELPEKLKYVRCILGVVSGMGWRKIPIHLAVAKLDQLPGFREFFANATHTQTEQISSFRTPQKVLGGKGVSKRELRGLWSVIQNSAKDHLINTGLEFEDGNKNRMAVRFACELQRVHHASDLIFQGLMSSNFGTISLKILGWLAVSKNLFEKFELEDGVKDGAKRSLSGSKGDLLSKIVFRESGLVFKKGVVQRLRGGFIVATVTLVSLAMSSLWVRSYLKNTDLIATAEGQVAAYQAAAAHLPPSPVGDTDLVPVAAALNNLRDMPGNPVLSDPAPERAMTYGLYQGEVIGTQAAQAYRAALNQRLLPRLLVRLEQQIEGNINNPGKLYDALKIYLMLGLQGPMNQDLIKDWMRLDWEIVAYPEFGRNQLRTDLMDHLTALLSQPMEEIALNGPLIAQAQNLLSEMPLAQRVYNDILNSEQATSLPKWRITDVGGPSVKRVLVRSSGKPLNDGIEGIFTFDGFHNVFLPEAVSVAERVHREAWVLGEQNAVAQTEAVLLKLSRDVLDLYYDDYISRYDQILGDIDIVPLESLSHAVEVTNVLSGPVSPIVNILTGVSNETRLNEDKPVLDAGTLAAGAQSLAAIEARSNLSIQGQILLEALVGSATIAPGQVAKPPGAFVQERFEWLYSLVNRPEGQPSQLDDLMGQLQLVYQELNKMSFLGVAADAPAGRALLQFQQTASRMGGPLPRWATQISAGSSGITSEGTRASINTRWQSTVLPFCELALKNRYPFNRSARADVAMADFAALFSPGGMIDNFFNDQLIRYVDTRTRPWTWKRVNDADLGISQAVLQQMQYAAEIKEAFFASGAQLAVQFQITVNALDPKASGVLLEIDGAKIEYNHSSGTPSPVTVTWPGSVGLARITLLPKKRDAENVMSRDGPWAWFRLLDAAEVRRTNVSDRRRVNFRVGGRLALFELQSGSVINPFALPALAKFSCPKSM